MRTATEQGVLGAHSKRTRTAAVLVAVLAAALVQAPAALAGHGLSIDAPAKYAPERPTLKGHADADMLQTSTDPNVLADAVAGPTGEVFGPEKTDAPFVELSITPAPGVLNVLSGVAVPIDPNHLFSPFPPDGAAAASNPGAQVSPPLTLNEAGEWEHTLDRVLWDGDWVVTARQARREDATSPLGNLVTGVSRTITVDTTPPVVDVHPMAPSTTYSAPVSMEVVVTDGHLEDSNLNPTRQDITCSAGSATFTFPATEADNLGDNAHTATFTVPDNLGPSVNVTCTATDLAGNPGSDSETLTFGGGGGDTAPVVTLSPDPAAQKGLNDYFTGDTTRVNVGAQDGNLTEFTCAVGGVPATILDRQDTATGSTGHIDIAEDGNNLAIACTAKDGTHTVTQPLTPALSRDHIEPITSATVEGSSSPHQVTLTVTNESSLTSNVDKTYYTTDGSTPTTSSPQYNEASKPSMNDGEVIKFFSVDRASNVESPAKSVTIGTADTTPPQVALNETTTPDGSNGYYRTAAANVHVTVTADDFAGLSCTRDNAAFTPQNASDGGKQGDIPVSGDGAHTVACTASDTTGNVSPVVSKAINVDGAPPATTDDVPASASGDSYTATLTPTDGVSGVDKTHYTTDGSTPTTSSPQYNAASKPVLQDGQSIKYFSVDRAGNSEAVKDSGPIDLVPADPGTGGDTGGSIDVIVDQRSADGGSTGATQTTTTTSAPTVQASATLPAQKLAAVLKKGFAVVITAAQPSKVTAKLLVDKKTAKRLRLKSTVLGSKSASLPAGRRTVSVPLSAAAKRALRRVRLLKAKVELTVANAQGAKKTIVKPVTLRR